MTPEGKVVAGVEKILKDRNIWYVNNLAGAHTRKGVPDITACYQGYFLALELKRFDQKGHVTPVQKKELMAIYENGGIACIIDDLNFLNFVLDWLLNDQEVSVGMQTDYVDYLVDYQEKLGLVAKGIVGNIYEQKYFTGVF